MTEIRLNKKEQVFIDEQVDAGVYENADEVVRAGLRLLRSPEGKAAELKRLINEGLDDIRNGRVHHYDSSEDLLNDILRMAAEGDKSPEADH